MSASPPTRLFLLRHGEVETRYHRIFGGRIDMELSPRGHEQAKTLAAYLAGTHFNSIYVSVMAGLAYCAASGTSVCCARFIGLT